MTQPRIDVESCHDLPLVHFQLLFPGGALSDPANERGLARLAARLIRRGTRTRNATEVEEAIDALGGEVGIEVGHSYVRICGSVIRRNAEAMLELVGELLREPALGEREFAQLQRETLATLTEILDNDGALAGMHLRRMVYGDHPYARSTMGTHASVKRCTVEAVRAYHRRTLACGPTLVGFAGDVTDAEARLWTEQQLRGLGSGTGPNVPALPSCEGRILAVVDKPARSQSQIYVGAPGTHASDPDHFALLVGNAVFGGTFTSRLVRAVRSERGWSYGASSRLGLDRVRGLWTMWTHPAAADAADCLALQLELMHRWLEGGVDEEELRFAKSYLSKSFAFSVDTAEKRLDQRIEQRVLELPENYYSEYVARIQNVSLDDVNTALKTRLSTEHLRVSVLATESTVGDSLRTAIPTSSYHVWPFDREA